MTDVSRNSLLLSALVLGLGAASAGALIGNGFARMRTADRTVAVKGVSEREAKADLAIWPLRLVATDNDLARANTMLEQNVQAVRRFLHAQGLDTTGSELAVQDFSVQDTRTMGGNYNASRYVIHQTLVVRSSLIDQVQAASQKVPDLVRDGVVLSSGQEYGNGGPTFVFTKLNDLKPTMIAEATARAREAAEQFAKDSRSDLTGIRNATQGYFEILPRDQAQGMSEETQVMKRVRVVTTVSYGLR